MISLKRKLVFYFLSLGILTIITLSWFSYDHAKRAIMDRTMDQLTSIKIIKKRNLENFYDNRLKEIRLISRTNAMARLFESLYRKLDVSDSLLIDETLTPDYPYVLQYLHDCGYYKEILFYRPGPFVISGAIRHPRHYTWEKNLSDAVKLLFENRKANLEKNEIIITDYIMMSGTGGYHQYIIAPLFMQRKRTGWLAVRLDGAVIDSMMVESNPRHGLGLSGESYLVGADYRMRSRSRFDTASVMKTEVRTKAVEQALKDSSGSMTITDYRGVQVLSSFDRLDIPFFNWMILVEMDMEEAMVPIIIFQKYLWVISGTMTLILSVLIYLIARNITRPLLYLKTAADRLRKGETSHPIPVQASDELGQLTEAFNDMTAQILQQTSVLKERDERLQLLHDATTDGVMLHDHGKPILSNLAMGTLTGYTSDELMRMHLGDILHVIPPADVSDYEKSSRLYESTATCRDGHTIPVEVQERLIEYNGKKIQAVVIRDITKRRLMENALREERVKRISSVIDGQEQERERLSRELHDGLGQNLVAIKLMLEGADVGNPESTRQLLSDVRSMFDATIEEVRRISNDLMPATLSQFGLETAIRQLGQTIRHTAGIDVTFDIQIDESELDNKRKLYIFRIIQEALHNTLKHAQATAVSVTLSANPDHYRLSVSDNGKGFDQSAFSSVTGHGIHNIRVRVNLMNGLLHIDAQPGRGTLIAVTIPKL